MRTVSILFLAIVVSLPSCQKDSEKESASDSGQDGGPDSGDLDGGPDSGDLDGGPDSGEPDGGPDVGIKYVVSNEVKYALDPRLFGQFMERPSWSGEIGPEGALVPGTNELQPKVYELIDDMDIPILRFPGGTDVDFMNWEDMISNVPDRGAERPVSVGIDGDNVTNNFGYDEFLRFADETNSEPIIVVNLRDALMEVKTVEEAAQHAAGLVAYCNAAAGADLPAGMPDWPAVRATNGHSEPYGVKYWQIGNETWLFFAEVEMNHPTNAVRHYADCLLAYMNAMLEVDPSIEFIVDGHDRTVGAFRIVEEEMGEKIRWVNFHWYQPWGMELVVKDGVAVSAEDLSASDIWNAWVAVPGFDGNGLSVVSHPLLGEAREKGFKVSVAEWNWNGWWSSSLSVALKSAFAKGVGAAGMLHAFMRSADVIEVGCQSMLVGNAWGITAIRADRDGVVPPYYMPTGQVTMMYSKHHGSNVMKLESDEIETYSQPYMMGDIDPSAKVAYLDALATADDGAVFFHVINRHFDDSAEITIDLSDFGPLEGKANHYVLEGRLENAPGQGESNQIAEITSSEITFSGSSVGVVLPNRSVSTIEIPLKP